MMTEGAGTAIIPIEAGHITNIEVEQRRRALVARALTVAERVGTVAVGGVYRGVLRVVGGVLSGGFRACEYWRKVAVGGPLAEVIIEVYLIETEVGTRKLRYTGVGIVGGEIRGGIERPTQPFADLCEREAVVLVHVAT